MSSASRAPRSDGAPIMRMRTMSAGAPSFAKVFASAPCAHTPTCESSGVKAALVPPKKTNEASCGIWRASSSVGSPLVNIT